MELSRLVNVPSEVNKSHDGVFHRGSSSYGIGPTNPQPLRVRLNHVFGIFRAILKGGETILLGGDALLSVPEHNPEFDRGATGTNPCSSMTRAAGMRSRKVMWRLAGLISVVLLVCQVEVVSYSMVNDNSQHINPLYPSVYTRSCLPCCTLWNQHRKL